MSDKITLRQMLEEMELQCVEYADFIVQKEKGMAKKGHEFTMKDHCLFRLKRRRAVLANLEEQLREAEALAGGES